MSTEIVTALPDEGKSFADLAALEPRLAALLAEAHDPRRRGGADFDGEAAFFGFPGHGSGFKRRLLSLVGMHRPDRDPRLSPSDAYETAYFAILNALEGRQ